MKNFLKSIGITKDTLIRAGRTFIQAAAAYIIANIAIVDFNSDKQIVKSAVAGLAASAIAAGIAAVMNLDKESTKEGE